MSKNQPKITPPRMERAKIDRAKIERRPMESVKATINPIIVPMSSSDECQKPELKLNKKYLPEAGVDV